MGAGIPEAAGAGLTLLDHVFMWFTDEAGRIEIKKRAALRAKKEECVKALHEKRFSDLRRLTDELERLSNAP